MSNKQAGFGQPEKVPDPGPGGNTNTNINNIPIPIPIPIPIIYQSYMDWIGYWRSARAGAPLFAGTGAGAAPVPNPIHI